MIGKIIKGKGFGGAVRYAMQKDLGEAQLIGTNLVADRNDADALAAEMAEHAALLRPEVKKAVQHVSLSAAPGEHRTDEQWRRVADAYMDKMGFKDNQYVLVRHADTGHDHVHLIVNRVSMSGELVSTRFDYRRQEIALDRSSASRASRVRTSSWRSRCASIPSRRSMRYCATRPPSLSGISGVISGARSETMPRSSGRCLGC